MITPNISTTSEEYRQLVTWYTGLVEAAFSEAETYSGATERAARVPHLISAVNVIGYLRGQHNLFLESRPDGIDYQKDLYALEDAFEKRLTAFIGKLQDEGYDEVLTKEITQYYITFRLTPYASI